MLTLEDFEIDSTNLKDDEEAEAPTDLRDIEFQLMHNMNEIHVGFQFTVVCQFQK